MATYRIIEKCGFFYVQKRFKFLFWYYWSYELKKTGEIDMFTGYNYDKIVFTSLFAAESYIQKQKKCIPIIVKIIKNE